MRIVLEQKTGVQLRTRRNGLNQSNLSRLGHYLCLVVGGTSFQKWRTKSKTRLDWMQEGFFLDFIA
jgi:hypothetical protein